jgi:hypothetical protein
MSLYLLDDQLGRLDLDCDNGFVVINFDIGWPRERPVVRDRALTDGVQDDTKYLGQRAVTVALRLDSSKHPTQSLLDQVTPYLSPRRRPLLVWNVQAPSAFVCGLQDDPTYERTLRLRGTNMPLSVNQPKYTTIICQWVSTDSYALSLNETCAVAGVTGTEEDGRSYDLDFDRSYPFSLPFGVTQFNVLGNAPSDWTGTVTGEIEDPQLLINGVLVTFVGLTLLAGQTINIDTKERTILRNNDPNDSVFGFSNFSDWAWDELRFQSGTNTIRLQGDNTVGDPSFTVCWRDAWF